jgi:NADH-quinone oxidoreductase subunit M
MNSWLLVLIPLLLAPTVFIFDNHWSKRIALFSSITSFIYSILLLINYCSCSIWNYEFNQPWISSLGINFSLGIDGISMVLVLLTTLLSVLIILSVNEKEYVNSKWLFFLILAMESGLLGVFTAKDAFVFYIFWELALIPVYFISLIWGGEERKFITFKFFIYTLVGSLFMLLAIIILYLNNPGKSFAIAELYETGRNLSYTNQAFVFWFFFLAFAIKMPIFPLHTWQPSTYTQSPIPGTMLLSGIMLKMGVYGVIRWLFPMVPDAWNVYAHYALVLSVIGVIYGSFIAIKQTNLKTMFAYISIAHVGLIAAGVFVANTESIGGAIIQMFSHGINVVGLFYIAQIIQNRTNTFDIQHLGGIRLQAPIFTIMFMIVLLSSVALPLTAGFIGEFMLLAGIFEYQMFIAAIAGLTLILGAIYMLNMFQKVMLGEINGQSSNFIDLHLQEKLVLLPIVLIIIFLGVYPQPLLNLIEPSVIELVKIATKY